MAARAFMEQVRTVILQRLVRETRYRSVPAGAFQSLIDVLILVKVVLVLSTPGPPPLRRVVTPGCPGAGDSYPGCRRRRSRPTPTTSSRLPLPACPVYHAAQ